MSSQHQPATKELLTKQEIERLKDARLRAFLNGEDTSDLTEDIQELEGQLTNTLS